jgi:hypothetical protein
VRDVVHAILVSQGLAEASSFAQPWRERLRAAAGTILLMNPQAAVIDEYGHDVDTESIAGKVGWHHVAERRLQLQALLGLHCEQCWCSRQCLANKEQ